MSTVLNSPKSRANFCESATAMEDEQDINTNDLQDMRLSHEESSHPSSPSCSGGDGDDDGTEPDVPQGEDGEAHSVLLVKKARKDNPLLSTTEKCRVCGEIAAKHVHYGSVTCFSCRAFFRRSIQSKASSNYTCRRQGKCQVMLKSRKNCQKCRYDKCLLAGMKPTWVLSEEERSRRFRKTREKKARQGSQASSPGHRSDDSSNPDPLPDSGPMDASPWVPDPVGAQPGSSDKSSLPMESSNCSTGQSSMAQCYDNPESRHKNSPLLDESMANCLGGAQGSPITGQPFAQKRAWQMDVPPSGPSTSTLAKFVPTTSVSTSSGIPYGPIMPITEEEVIQIRQICYEYDKCYRSVAFGEDLIKDMVMCSVYSIPLDPYTAMTAYRLMIQRVAQVANDFDLFKGLDGLDQRALMKTNADLIVSLRGAVFFDEKKKGLDQILFSLGVDDVELGKEVLMSTMKATGTLGRIHYRNYNSIQQLDHEPTENKYSMLMTRVGSLVSTIPDLVKIMSYVLLFCPDYCELEDKPRVQNIQQMMLNMVQRMIQAQFPSQIAKTMMSQVLRCIPDLRELTLIKRKRPLAKPTSNSPPRLNSPPAMPSSTATTGSVERDPNQPCCSSSLENPTKK